MVVFNPDLVEDIAHRRVVLFLGSGVSASAKTNSGTYIRQWEAFLLDAAKRVLRPEERILIESRIHNKDYLMAAELLKHSLQHEWDPILENEFAQVAEASELHKAIVGLGQRIIITTNFDKLLENAWTAGDKSVTHHPALLTKLDSDSFKMLRDNRNYIIKLHGTIDDPSNMIFTKSEYNQRAFGSWIYDELLRVLLLTHTFLFIGFSMTDPAITLLIEMYAQRFPNARPHYIFLSAPVEREVIDLSRKLRRLYILPYDPKDNHAELVKHINFLSAAAKAKSREFVAPLLPDEVRTPSKKDKTKPKTQAHSSERPTIAKKTAKKKPAERAGTKPTQR